MYERRASSIYSTLSADGHEAAEDQMSRPRKAFMALCAALLLLSAPLLWANAALAGGDVPSAVLSKDGEDNSGPGNGDDDDEDNSGPGNGDDDSSKKTGNSDTSKSRGDSATTTNSSNTGPGTNTKTNTDTRGDKTKGENTGHDGTKGKTGDRQDRATGRETKGQNTDRPGMHTGVSTRGETDPGDNTGKTERR